MFTMVNTFAVGAFAISAASITQVTARGGSYRLNCG
jgi:hypothetical protein